MTYEELHAALTTSWYRFARYVTDDGIVYTIGSIGDVASRNLAVVILDADGKLIKVCDHLYASQELAKQAAQEMRDRHNKALKREQS